MLKRLLSLLLALALLISAMPIPGFAEETEPAEAVVLAEETSPAEEAVLTEETIAVEETVLPEETAGEMVPEEPAQKPTEEAGETGIVQETIPEMEASGTAVDFGEFGDGLIWMIFADGTLFITGNGDMPDYNDWNNRPPWFKYRNQITDVVVLSGVTRIGSFAFAYLDKMTSFNLQQSDAEISSYAFSYCKSLTDVVLPKEVPAIGSHAFYGCEALETITLPENLTLLGSEVFSYSGLKNVTVPGSLTQLGDAFACCFELETVILPAGLTDLDGTFAFCDKLTTINLPEGLQTIGDSTFGYCNALTELTLPSTVTSIGANAFYSCRALNRITLPGNLTAIGDMAFQNCESLKEVVLPNGLTVLGKAAFKRSGLETVTLPGSIAQLPADIFEECPALKSAVVSEGITVLPDNTFRGCTALTEVSLPKDLTSIGANSFLGCTSLQSIALPEELTQIGETAFEGCTALISVSLPDSLQTVGMGAFSSCTKLAKILLPEGLTTLGNWAFSNCTSLTAVSIPDSVTGLGTNLFQNCTGLTAVRLPETLQELSSGCFYGCTSLETIRIPDSVAAIGNGAFYGCSGLKEITLPENILVLNNDTFADCTSLAKISLPRQTHTMHAYVFRNCTSLKSIVLPDALTAIGHNAFNGCTALESIVLPDTLTAIEFNAFNGCTALESIVLPNALTAIKSHAFDGCTALESVVLPEGLTTIGSEAFRGCIALTEISIPQGVTYVTEKAFSGCTRLEQVCFPGMKTKFDYTAFTDCPMVTLLVHRGSEAAYYAAQYDIPYQLWEYKNIQWTLENGTLTISGSGVIADADEKQPSPWATQADTITAVVVEPGITAIGSYAFADLDSLTSVSLPQGIISLGDCAFYDCNALTAIALPEGLTSIGSSTFQGCKALTAVTVPEGVTALAESVFEGCTYLETVTLPDTLTAIGNRAFYESWSLKEINMPQGLKTIGEEAFYMCGYLAELVLPEGVTRLGKSAFSDCPSLLHVTLPGTVTDFGKNVFYDCEKLTSVVIGEGVTAIGNYMFYNCDALTSVTLPESLRSIGDHAFAGCKKLKQLVIPEGVTTIDPTAFAATVGHSAPSLAVYPGSYAEAFARDNKVTYTLLDCKHHDVTFTEGMENTCDTDGNLPHWKCAVCGTCWADEGRTQDISGKEILPAGHVLTHSEKLYADCTNEGQIEYWHCSRCDTYWSDMGLTNPVEDLVIPAYGHSLHHTQALEPGATTEGNLEYWYCDSCCLYWLDEALTQPTTPEAVVLPATGILASGTCGDNAAWVLRVGGELTISGTGPMADNQAGGAPWYWNYNHKIQSVVVEEGITSLGSCSLYGCNNLTTIRLPETLTFIGEMALFNCTGLTELTIPEGVTTIGSAAFTSCDSLETLVLPLGLTVLSSQLLADCAKLHTVVLPEGLQKIEFSVFRDCPALKTVNLPKNADLSSASGLFNNCTALEGVTLPESMTVIPWNFFLGCSGLKEVQIPASVTKLGNNAFQGCAALETFSLLPDWDLTQATGLLKGCTGLKTVTIPTGMKKIPRSFLEDCTGLEEVILPQSLTAIGDSALAGCTALTSLELPESLTAFGEKAFYGCSQLSGLFLLETVTEFGAEVFGNCGNLVLTLCPNSPAEAYAKNNGVSYVYVPWAELASGTCGDALSWSLTVGGELTISGTGDMTDYDYNSGPWYSHRKTIRTVILEEGITSIGDYAFKYCNMESITLPSTLVEIGQWAFQDCGKLTEVVLPEGLTTLDACAFLNCYGLTSVVCPASLKNIIVPFGECANLVLTVPPYSEAEKYAVENKIPYVHSRVTVKEGDLATVFGAQAQVYANPSGSGEVLMVLEPNTVVEVLRIGSVHDVQWALLKEGWVTADTLEPLASTGSGQCGNNMYWETYRGGVLIITGSGTMWTFDNGTPWKGSKSTLKTVILEDGITYIAANAFSDCSQLTTVKLPDTLVSIGEGAFLLCENLAQITLPDTLKEIGSNAFAGCGKLKAVHIPERVATLEAGAFQGCAALTEVTLPSSLTELKDFVFMNCTSLKTVSLPENLTIVESDAFSGCTALESIRIPDTVMEIDGYAFSGCTNLKTVHLGSGLTKIGSYAFRNCRSLETAELPNTVKRIGSGAFEDCGLLTGMTIPYAAELGDNVFSRCDRLTLSVYPDSRGLTYAEEYGISYKLLAPPPAAKDVRIVDASGNDLTGQTLDVDISRTDSFCFYARLEPADSLGHILWHVSRGAPAGSSPPATEAPSVDATDSDSCQVRLDDPGTVTVTVTLKGTNKSASVKLNGFYLDTAKKLTASADIPKTGLPEGQSVQLQVWGTQALGADQLIFYSSDAEIASVDETGRITAGSKAGTAIITAAIPWDPLERSVSLKVKTIPAQTRYLTLLPDAPAGAEVEWLDGNGQITQDPQEAIRATLYLDAADLVGNSLFTVKARAINSLGREQVLTDKSLKWSVSDSRIATVKAAGNGNALVTVKKGSTGACVITAVTKDTAKVEAVLTIHVRSFAPRLERAALTLNTNRVAGVTTGLHPSYGNEILSATVHDYDSSAKTYAAGESQAFDLDYAEGKLTLTHTATMKNGSYKLLLKAVCQDGTTYEYNLTVKVANSLPSVTVKQQGKLNLFYTDGETRFTLAAKDAAITDVTLAEGSNDALAADGYDAATGTLGLRLSDAYLRGQANLGKKAELEIRFAGYRVSLKKTVTLATEKKAPKLTLSPASSLVSTAVSGEHSAWVEVLGAENVHIAVAADFAESTVEGNRVKLTLKDAVGGTAILGVTRDNWTAAVELKHKVTVKNQLPTVKLKTAALKLNKLLGAGTEAETCFVLPAGVSDFAVTDMLCLGEYRGFALSLEDGILRARLTEPECPAGKYSLKLYPIVTHLPTGQTVTLEKPVAVSVQIFSGKPSVTVKASGKLDAILPDSEITYTISKMTNIAGTPTAVRLEGADADLFAVELQDGNALVKGQPGAQFRKNGSYKLSLVYTIAGQEVSAPVTVKVGQSAMKFAPLNAVNLYQANSRMAVVLEVTAPQGAGVQDIVLSNKSAKQFLQAAGENGLTWTELPDGRLLLSFRITNPGFLTYGKSYTVCLDITPKGNAVNVKPQQLKLTVKTFQ